MRCPFFAIVESSSRLPMRTGSSSCIQVASCCYHISAQRACRETNPFADMSRTTGIRPGVRRWSGMLKRAGRLQGGSAFPPEGIGAGRKPQRGGKRLPARGFFALEGASRQSHVADDGEAARAWPSRLDGGIGGVRGTRPFLALRGSQRTFPRETRLPGLRSAGRGTEVAESAASVPGDPGFDLPVSRTGPTRRSRTRSRGPPRPGRWSAGLRGC